MGILHSGPKKGDEDVANPKKEKDIYLEMRRRDDPDFGGIPKEDLEKRIKELDAAKSAASAPDIKTEKPRCISQQDNLTDLFLGLTPGFIHLWNNGSVINWIARMDDYPNRDMAYDAAVSVYLAARRWNEVLEGRVTFRYVSSFDDAAFMVQYGGDLGRVLASAFFPASYRRPLNILNVYEFQFSREQKPFIVNTMLHELGHVLGLRHEHSHEGIPGTTVGPEDRPGGPESVVWGARNDRSVMSYTAGPPKIQDTDVADIRAAYDRLRDGDRITGEGRFQQISKTIRRVAPNN